MKNLKKLFWLPLAVAMVFASCSSEVSDGSVSVYTEQTEKITTASGTTTIGGMTYNVYTVPVALSNVNGNGEFEVARTVLPETMTLAKVSKYILTGASEYGTILETIDAGVSTAGITISKTDIETGITNGKGAPVSLAACKWELTLTAYDSSNNAILVGYQTVDFKNGGYRIDFSLSGSSITGPGTVDLKASLTTLGSAASAKINLYNVLTGKSVGEATAPSSGFSTNKYVRLEQSIDAGSYNMEVYFYTSTGNVCGFYSDSVIVDANNKTTLDKNCDRLLGSVPAAPTLFKAERVISEGVSPSAMGTKYQVKFTWQDNSDNERYFSLKVTSKATETSGGETVWIGGMTDTANPHVYYALFDSEIPYVRYVSGSLFAGSETVTLEFDTGRFYDVSIYATNPIGNSTECAREKSETDTAALKGYDIVKTDGTTPLSINLMRIMYNLCGGQFHDVSSGDWTATPPATTDTPGSSENVVEYKVWGTDTFTVMTAKKPETPTADYTCLERNTIPFDHWAEAENSDTEFTTFENGKNTILYAVYQKPGIYVDIYNEADIDGDRVTAKYSNPNVTPTAIENQPCIYDSGDPDTACDAKKAGGSIVITIGAPLANTEADPHPDQKIFSKYYFEMSSSDGGGVSKKSGIIDVAEYTFNVNDLAQGLYNVLAGGYYNDRLYTYQFQIKINR